MPTSRLPQVAAAIVVIGLSLGACGGGSSSPKTAPIVPTASALPKPATVACTPATATKAATALVRDFANINYLRQPAYIKLERKNLVADTSATGAAATVETTLQNWANYVAVKQVTAFTPTKTKAVSAQNCTAVKYQVTGRQRTTMSGKTTTSTARYDVTVKRVDGGWQAGGLPTAVKGTS